MSNINPKFISFLHVFLVRIRKIENITSLVSLKKLFLGNNRIEKIEGLDSLVNLHVLSLQNNRIRTIEGLTFLCNLSELYLSFNQVSNISGVATLKKLRILDLGNNDIHILSNISDLPLLDDLWINNNNISNWLGVEELCNTHVSCIYLEHNPISQDPMYRKKLKLAINTLNQIDATPCWNDISQYHSQMWLVLLWFSWSYNADSLVDLVLFICEN